MQINIPDRHVTTFLDFCKKRVEDLNEQIQNSRNEMQEILDIVESIEGDKPEEQEANASGGYQTEQVGAMYHDCFGASDIDTEIQIPPYDRNWQPTASDDPRRNAIIDNKPKGKRQPNNTIARTEQEAKSKLGIKRRHFKKPVEEEKPKKQREAPAVYSNTRSLYPELNKNKF